MSYVCQLLKNEYMMMMMMMVVMSFYVIRDVYNTQHLFQLR